MSLRATRFLFQSLPKKGRGFPLQSGISAECFKHILHEMQKDVIGKIEKQEKRAVTYNHKGLDAIFSIFTLSSGKHVFGHFWYLFLNMTCKKVFILSRLF